MKFTYDSIDVNPCSETERIISFLRVSLKQLKKRGVVVGISGGVDSSVVLALCAEAFGAKNVLGVMIPEKETSPESLVLAKDAADRLNINTVIEDITPVLTGLGCYTRRDSAVKRIFPFYDSSYKMKIFLNPGGGEKLNNFYIKIISAEGKEGTRRLSLNEYLEIVAATNMKQRCRMSTLYYHAEIKNFAVAGTGNKNEHEQGFFVKYGDGAADIKPISHLLKTQVYQLAGYLKIPEQIIARIPTTDTYSAEQTQEEFFFQHPFEILDRVWYASEHGYNLREAAEVLKMPVEEVNSIKENLHQKIRSTGYLRLEPLSLH